MEEESKEGGNYVSSRNSNRRNKKKVKKIVIPPQLRNRTCYVSDTVLSLSQTVSLSFIPPVLYRI